MPLYSVYGTRLDSEIEFPELPLATRGPARWKFRVDESLPAMQDAVMRGAEVIYGDVQARLYSHRRGLRIVVDDTGEFDVAPNGNIVAATRPGAWDDFLRNHLLGRVLAIAMFEAGWLPLHAAAVETAEGIIAFLGPNGIGKSAMALALNLAGAPLVADDTLPLESGLPPRALPGLPTIRVREDVRDALAVHEAGLPTHEGKVALLPTAGRRTRSVPGALAGIYLLVPGAGDPGAAAVARTPYSPALAAPAVLAHVRAGGLLGATAVGTMLQRISPIVNMVPVHQLSVTRDLSRLMYAARQILSWYVEPA